MSETSRCLEHLKGRSRERVCHFWVRREDDHKCLIVLSCLAGPVDWGDQMTGGPVDWGDQLIEGTSWLRGPVEWEDQLIEGTSWLGRPVEWKDQLTGGTSCTGCRMKWLPGQRQKTDRVLAQKEHVTILLATPILLSFLSTYDGPLSFNILQTQREPDQVQSMFFEF